MIYKFMLFFQNSIQILLKYRKKRKHELNYRTILLTGWHVFFFVHQIFSHTYGFRMISKFDGHHQEDIGNMYKYSWGMATNWNFTLQSIFLILALICDGLEWTGRHKTKTAINLKYWRDIVFSGFVFPFTMFVTTMFWSVYLIDRELVFPKIFDNVVPFWFNHCVHTNIFVVIAVETLLQPRRSPANATLEQMLCWIVNLSYTIVYYSIYFITNRWLYQVFRIMTWWQICLYQLLIWASIYIYYKIQYPINRLVHGKERNLKNKNVTINTFYNNERNAIKRNKIETRNSKECTVD